ncbi:MAG: hypothetical protein M3134_02765 [Actinomycetota bacterium]|nr:hypothetical protein [Actinomycetota bacterium]
MPHERFCPCKIALLLTNAALDSQPPPERNPVVVVGCRCARNTAKVCNGFLELAERHKLFGCAEGDVSIIRCYGDSMMDGLNGASSVAVAFANLREREVRPRLFRKLPHHPIDDLADVGRHPTRFLPQSPEPCAQVLE